MINLHNPNLSKLRLFMLTAAVAAGMGAAAAPALAADGTVSERDMLTQAVALYEKLTGTVVEETSDVKAKIEELTGAIRKASME